MPAPRNPDDAAPEAQALAALAAEARALSLQIGVTGADAAARLGAGARLAEFVAAGRHGEMAWMARRMAERADPRALWPAARSVVMVAENYGPAADPLAALERPERAAISAYAQSADYHDVLKKKLKRLGRALIDAAARAGAPGAEIKVFVDTAPVMEKPLAEAAGLGWRGKHTNLVARGRGSWLFLGAIFTTLALPETAPETDHCGACRRCLDICPTDAFPAPYQLDARRCLSYLTIELKGPIPRAFRRAMGNRIYGCDDCLAVCPWNKFAEHAAERAYWARAELKSPRLTELAALSDADFRAIFSGSPIKRIGRGRFVRNVMIALGNLASGPPAEAAAARAAARARLDDADPLVRGAAAWALSRLDPEAFAAEGAARAAREPDAAARAEWTAPPE